MLKLSKLAALAAVAMMGLLWGAPAQAQATRTWISGVGDDANPCSRTAPCKTFAGAISKTAAGGEIDCLDPGGFGGVTVTKSITMDCGGGIGGQVGSILVSSGNGITVNAASGNVKIRNMTINGIIGVSGSASSDGIRFIQGNALIVEHVGIFGFGGAAGSQAGLSFEPGNQVAGNAAKLYMLDVEIQYGLADAIAVRPQNGGSAQATLSRVTTMSNGGSGLRVDVSSLTTGAGASVVATGSTFAGSAQFGVFCFGPAGSRPLSVALVNDTISSSGINAVVANGPTTFVTLGGSTVAGNVAGMATSNSGTLKSFGDNWFSINGSDGTSTAPNLGKL